jgi:hypothetical protein
LTAEVRINNCATRILHISCASSYRDGVSRLSSAE